MLKILVTGGCGFIGSHIVDKLIDLNYYVRVLDINKKNINKKAEYIIGSITDYNTCLKACKDIDIICHQAAFTSVPKSIDESLNNNYTNILGTLNLLEIAKINNIKRFVYASSSAIYGDIKDDVFIEDRIGKPESPYSLSKYTTELYGDLYTRLYDLECIGLRYFNVYGPRTNSGVIPIFINLLKNNEQPTIYDKNITKNYIHVDDVINANLLAMFTNNKESFGKTFNIGSNELISNENLFYLIRKLLNKDIEPKYERKRQGDVSHGIVDQSKVYEYLNFIPKYSLREGLKKILKYD